MAITRREFMEAAGLTGLAVALTNGEAEASVMKRKAEARAWPSLVITDGEVTGYHVPLLIYLLGHGAAKSYLAYNGSDPERNFLSPDLIEVIDGSERLKSCREIHLDRGADYTSVDLECEDIGKSVLNYLSAAITSGFGDARDQLAFRISNLDQLLEHCNDPCITNAGDLGPTPYHPLANIVHYVNSDIVPGDCGDVCKTTWTKGKKDNVRTVAAKLAGPGGESVLIAGPEAPKSLCMNSSMLELPGNYRLYLKPGPYQSVFCPPCQ
jgi:hypothetical protein